MNILSYAFYFADCSLAPLKSTPLDLDLAHKEKNTFRDCYINWCLNYSLALDILESALSKSETAETCMKYKKGQERNWL